MGKHQLGIVFRSILVVVELVWLRFLHGPHWYHRMDSLDKLVGLLQLDIYLHQIHQPNGLKLEHILVGYSRIVVVPKRVVGSRMGQGLDSIGSIVVVELDSIAVGVDSIVAEVVVVEPTWPVGYAISYYHKLGIRDKQLDQHRQDIEELVDVDLRSIQSRKGMPVKYIILCNTEHTS